MPSSKPYTYAHVHRSNTSKRPILSLDPVQLSLTEGTDIPPPPPLPVEVPTPPESPKRQGQQTPPNQNSARPKTGPLSSHPVTPSGDSGIANPEFPFSNSNTMGTPQSVPPTQQRPATAGASPLNGTHGPHASSLSSVDDQHQQQQRANGTTGRRPSFASRFLRLRSLSSLRSRNSSTTSLAQHNGTTDGHPDSPHGVKRPHSPSIVGMRVDANSVADSTPRQSQTFPRMMRKKSMELLSSARRRSGFWGGGENMNAMMEEAQREREREMDMERDEQELAGRGSSNGRQSALRNRGDSLAEPPPMLPALSKVKEMEGESMFDGIGRNE